MPDFILIDVRRKHSAKIFRQTSLAMGDMKIIPARGIDSVTLNRNRKESNQQRGNHFLDETLNSPSDKSGEILTQTMSESIHPSTLQTGTH
jgi:hypothetical protein